MLGRPRGIACFVTLCRRTVMDLEGAALQVLALGKIVTSTLIIML